MDRGDIQLRLVSKVHRRLVVEGAVEQLVIVKDFDSFKDGGPGVGARGELVTMDHFAFETAPEDFYGALS